MTVFENFNRHAFFLVKVESFFLSFVSKPWDKAMSVQFGVLCYNSVGFGSFPSCFQIDQTGLYDIFATRVAGGTFLVKTLVNVVKTGEDLVVQHPDFVCSLHDFLGVPL